MKKQLLVIAMTLVAGLSFGQVSIIPKAGASVYQIAFDDEDLEDENLNSKIGLTLGVASNFELSKVFSLQPELLFVQKGYKLDYSTTEEVDGLYSMKESLTGKVNINYLEIPVLARFTFGSGTKFYFYGGPSLGIGLGGKHESTYSFSLTSGGDIIASESEDSSGKLKFGEEPDNYTGTNSYADNAIDIGANFGPGVILFEKVMLDIRYNLGLTDIWDDYTSNNEGFQFTVGVPLILK